MLQCPCDCSASMYAMSSAALQQQLTQIAVCAIAVSSSESYYVAPIWQIEPTASSKVWRRLLAGAVARVLLAGFLHMDQAP